MSKPTVTAGFPKAFIDFAVSRGADRQKLIERSHINPEDLIEQDNRIPLGNYIALVKAGIELCGEPALSLLFGEAVSLQDISFVGLIEMGGTSIEGGRGQMNRYLRLMVDDGETSDRLELVRESGQLWFKFTSPIYVEYPLLAESGFARCVCSARAKFEAKGIYIKQPFPKAIHFTHREPSYRAEYERIFGVPLVFGSDMNALVVDEELLSIRPPQINPYLSNILKAHAEGLLKKLDSSKSTRGRVESLLIPLLPTGEASIDIIAKKLGLSRQTLFRKLKAENVTFEKVLDELRHRLALHYLNEKKISVNETAYLLGFSEPAAFSRAFKRWVGCSPRAAQASVGENNRAGLS